MSNDPKIIMPNTDDRGVSDHVFINTNDKQVCVAWFDKRDGYWHDEYQNTFGDVRRWYALPIDFHVDYDHYGGEE